MRLRATGASLATRMLMPVFGYTTSRCVCMILSPSFDGSNLVIQILCSAFIIVILYSLVFLSLRGNLITSGGSVEFRWRTSGDPHSEFSGTHVAMIARKMLWSVKCQSISPHQAPLTWVICLLRSGTHSVRSLN